MIAPRPGTDVASTHDSAIPPSPPAPATATTRRDNGLSTSPPAADIASTGETENTVRAANAVAPTQAATHAPNATNGAYTGK